MIGTCNRVTLIEDMGEVQHMKVEIDLDELDLFGNLATAQKCVGHTVEYQTRTDVINGFPKPVIVNMVEHVIVKTLDRTDTIALIPAEFDEDVYSNFSLVDFKVGDTSQNVVMFLSDYEIGTSPKARWYDLICIDRLHKIVSVRIFQSDDMLSDITEDSLNELIGKYVKFKRLQSTKYGIQTNGLSLFDAEVKVPVEVEIALVEIKRIIQDDAALFKYVEATGLLEKAKKTLKYELGYHLIEMATELYFIEVLNNVTRMYDTQALKRAVIASRGYLTTKGIRSKTISNLNRLAAYPELVKDTKLLSILDATSETYLAEREILIKIQKFVADILNERRGLIDYEKIENDRRNVMLDYFGFLL